jgi:catechol 2,3-dioxygenase-like lactoylglutathione lyase family enzyme
MTTTVPPPAPPPLTLDHVQIAAPRGAEIEARRFFGQILGLTELSKPEPLAARGGVWFACGAGQLHVGIEQDFHPAKKAHVALRVNHREALATLRARLEAHGVATREGEMAAGMVRFYADDPWGNRVEFVAPG